MDRLSPVCPVCGVAAGTPCECSPDKVLDGLKLENERLLEGLRRLRPTTILDADRGGSGSWHAVMTVGGHHRFWSAPCGSEEGAQKIADEANAALDILVLRKDPNWVHPCQAGEHDWFDWHYIDSVLADEDGIYWRYRRVCNRMGCVISEYSDSPNGEGKIKQVMGRTGLEDD